MHIALGWSIRCTGSALKIRNQRNADKGRDPKREELIGENDNYRTCLRRTEQRVEANHASLDYSDTTEVAMWRPMQIYLYDWWPLLRRSRIYAKLSHMPVEVLQKTKA